MTRLALLAVAGVAAGCNLVDSNGLHVGYSFDPQHFTESIGDSGTSATVPNVACSSGANPDQCTQAATAAGVPMTMVQVSCQSNACAATAEFTLPQKIDLRNAQTPLPSDAVQFGISAVAIDRIEYWLAKNTLNVATPKVDLYVAPDTAMDISDPSAVLLGSVASLPAMSTSCQDPADAQGDSAADGMPVCDVPLTDAGQAQLEKFVQNYMNAPFQIFVHATLTAGPGTPIPAGTLDLYVRPSVTLSILK